MRPTVSPRDLQVAVPDNVTGLAWAGSSLLCAVPDGYYVLRPSAAQHGLSSPTAAGAAAAGGVQYELVLLADHLTAISPLLGSIPDLRLALMAWEDNMVLVTDAAGEDCRLCLSLLSLVAWVSCQRYTCSKR